MPRVLAPLVLLLLWLMKIAASPHSLRIGEYKTCSDLRLTILPLRVWTTLCRNSWTREAKPRLWWLGSLPWCSAPHPGGLRLFLSYSVPPAFWKCSLLHLVNEMQFISSVRICIDFYGGNVTRWESLSV